MKKLTLETRAKRAAERRRVVLATAAAAGFAAMTFLAPSAWAQPSGSGCPPGAAGEYVCGVLGYLHGK